jgi:hypothetical protein
MKIRLDDKEGLAADTAIEIDAKESRTPSSLVTVGIWNGERYASVELTRSGAQRFIDRKVESERGSALLTSP